MAAEPSRYRITRRWRFHYPTLYITRVRLEDDCGAHVDLWDAEQAAKVAHALNRGETPTAKGMTKYRTVAWLRGRALIEQRRGAAIEEPVGVANGRALADRVDQVLNGLDPYHIAQAKRIRIYWF